MPWSRGNTPTRRRSLNLSRRTFPSSAMQSAAVILSSLSRFQKKALNLRRHSKTSSSITMWAERRWRAWRRSWTGCWSISGRQRKSSAHPDALTAQKTDRVKKKSSWSSRSMRISFFVYRSASSFTMSSQSTPRSTMSTMAWYRKSAISYLTSSGFGFLAAMMISVASSPTFFRILSIPLSKR